MVVYFIALLLGWGTKRFQPVRRWGHSEFAVAAVVIGLGGAFIRVALEVADPRLDNAVVCVADGGDPYTGLLVGEAKDAVYLGERSDRVVIANRRAALKSYGSVRTITLAGRFRSVAESVRARVDAAVPRAERASARPPGSDRGSISLALRGRPPEPRRRTDARPR